jgi:hypothetical protein
MQLGGRDAAMATVYVATAGKRDTYRIGRVYLDPDEAYRFEEEYDAAAPVEPVQVEEWENGAPPGVYDGRYWRAQWWARVPVSKRRTELRHTAKASDSMTRHPPGMVDRRRFARRQGGAPGTGRGAQSRGGGHAEGEGRGTVLGHDYPGQSGSGRSVPEVISANLCKRRNIMDVTTRHCRSGCVMMALWTNRRWSGSATKS